MNKALVTAPAMADWNLALRFGLEVVALAGLAFAAWKLPPGPIRLAVVIMPLVAALVWTVFNVPGDPSRSGSAPVAVPGWTRLLIELAILGAGVIALVLAGQRNAGIAYAILVAFHYAASRPRIAWLLQV